MQNSQCKNVIMYILHNLSFIHIIIGAFKCKQHFNVVAGQGGAYFTILYCWIV